VKHDTSGFVAVAVAINPRDLKRDRPILQCKLGYFGDDVVFGSKAYLEELFEARNPHFGTRQTVDKTVAGTSHWPINTPCVASV
jgi:hypothetical protein